MAIHERRVLNHAGVPARAGWFRGAFYRVIQGLSRPAFAILFRLRRHGHRVIPAEGPAILAANHVSYLDPGMVGSTCPRIVRFLIHHGVFRKPGQRWFYRAMLSIPVDRTGPQARAALRAGLAALRSGEVIGIFPEGGRVIPGSEPPLIGVALLARRSGAPVIPVGIRGTDRAMPRGAALPRPVRVSVHYGEPIAYVAPGEGAGPAAIRAADLAFTESLMLRIRELAGAGKAP